MTQSGSTSIYDPELRVDKKLVSVLRSCALASALIVLLYAISGCIGWIFDIQPLKRPLDLKPAPQPATVVALLLVGVGLILAHPRKVAAFKYGTWVVAAIVIVVGCVNLSEHLLGLDWNLAHPIFQISADSTPLTFPGQIVPDVALGLIILGLAILLKDFLIKGYAVGKILAGLLYLPSFAVISANVCGEPHICAFFGCLRLSTFTSLIFTFATFAILFSRPERSFTSIFAVNSLGGRLLRSVCIGLLCTIPLLFLIQRGTTLAVYEDKPLYDERLAFMLMGLTTLTVLGACVMWGARKIDTVQVEAAVKADEADQMVQSMRESLEWSAANPRKTLKSVCLSCAQEYDNPSFTKCPVCHTNLAQISEDISVGAIFNEKYHVLAFLGKGGNSSVYKARHMLMNKMVALKILQDHLASDAKAVQRFQREAQSTGALSHPNLVAVSDFGLTTDGRAFLVMDYLEGESLSDFIERRGAITWREAVPIFIQIFDGLSHAHEKGIIHRDLKPANIMLVKGDGGTVTARVVDFGLAKVVEAEEASKLTRTGEIFGSPYYMSPEQCRGDKLDYRSDIYSMGCLMYQTLSGMPPYRGDNVFETLKMHVLNDVPSLPPDVVCPPWLNAAVRECLVKEPEQRRPNAAQLRDHLIREMTNSMRAQV